MPESSSTSLMRGKFAWEARLQDETVWLTQGLMAELYQTTKQNISLHIETFTREGELAAGQLSRNT